MKVYVCFDRYECDEYYNVFFIDTDRNNSIRKCKEETLPNFLKYGPDDCHSFVLVEVEVSEKDYLQLLEWNSDSEQKLEDHEITSGDYFNWMCELYNLVRTVGYEHMILIDF
jgi:hypothetical protein